jgi:hypothetical protein
MKIDLQHALNWQISSMRGWTMRDLEYGCSGLFTPTGALHEQSRHPEVLNNAMPNWFSDRLWPTLFAEFPEGVRLFRPTRLEIHDNKFESHIIHCQYVLCLCDSKELPAGPRICQPAETVAIAVCFAWMAWKNAQLIQIATVPEFSTVIH